MKFKVNTLISQGQLAGGVVSGGSGIAGPCTVTNDINKAMQDYPGTLWGYAREGLAADDEVFFDGGICFKAKPGQKNMWDQTYEEIREALKPLDDIQIEKDCQCPIINLGITHAQNCHKYQSGDRW